MNSIIINKFLEYIPVLSKITDALNDKAEKARNFAVNNLNSPFFGVIVLVGVIAFIFFAFGAFKR